MTRNLFLIVFLYLFTNQISAQNRVNQGGTISVFSVDVPFIIYLDNVRYNQEASSHVRVDNLSKRNYQVRVEFVSSGMRRPIFFTQSIQVVNEDNEYLDVTYSTGANRGRGRTFTLYSLFPVQPVYLPSNYVDVYNFGYPGRKLIGNNVPSQNSPYRNISPMTDREFDSFIASVRKEGFDKERLKIAEMVMRETAFSTQQIKAIMKQFSFDDGKLSIAKQAYANCIDKRNYSSLVDEFAFNKSKNDLLDYINSQY